MQYIAAQQQTKEQVANAWQKASEDYQKSFDTFMTKHNCTDK